MARERTWNQPALRAVWFGVLALAFAALAACTVRVDPPWDIPTPTDASDTVREDLSDTVPVLPDVPIPDVPGPLDLSFPDVYVPPPEDVVDDEVRDAGPEPDLPSFRYCPWDVRNLGRTSTSTVFRDESFLAAPTRTSPVDGACDNSLFPDREQPERVFLVEVAEEQSMVVRTRCDDWDCDAVVIRGECTTSNVQACMTTDGDERYEIDALPGPHLVIVERRAPFDPGDFALQVALNDSDGHEDCPVEGELSLALIETEGDCVAAEAGSYRQTTLSADTSDGMLDHVYLDCDGEGLRRDATGGAPDAIWRLLADQSDDAARSLSLELVPAGDWESFVAVTTAPCGASDAVIDCAQSLGEPTAVDGVTLFPGDEVYLVVDGVGDRAFDDRHAGPFELHVRVAVEACP